MQVFFHQSRRLRGIVEFIFPTMASIAQAYRLSASTGLHKGDRSYQQDQVAIIGHPRASGCALGIVADGMGGKSGGRKASDQVMMTARQLFETYQPGQEAAEELMRQVVIQAHMMIRLTAITAEEKPHSTLAAFVVNPDLKCLFAHAGDSRVYHFRGSELVSRTKDHSYVQRLIDDGRLTEEEANTHPQSNLLTGCLGTHSDPPTAVSKVFTLEVGDTVMACSDGLWHYYTPKELGTTLDALPPREAVEMLINKARQRARGGGDNLSLAVIRVDPLR
jgi:PPM family protein phosphatase